jgi:hypothetical protein
MKVPMNDSFPAQTRKAGLLAVVLAAVLALTGSTAWAHQEGPAGQDIDRGQWIALFPGAVEPILHDSSVPVWDREEGVVVAGPSDAQLDVLRGKGVEPIWSAPDNGEGIHILSHDRYFTPPVLTGVHRFEINDRAMLYLIPAGVVRELPGLKMHALFHGVPRVALPPVRVHPADVFAAPQVSWSP